MQKTDSIRQKFANWLRFGFWRNWVAFFSELWRRFRQPFGQPTLIFYFIGVILIVGGLGVLISGFEKTPAPVSLAVPRALSTYLLAILATAYVDLTLEDKAMRSVRMFALLILVVGTAAGVFSFVVSDVQWALRASLAGTVLALFLWWLANAENERFYEAPPPPTAAIPPGTQEPVGNLAGIKN